MTWYGTGSAVRAMDLWLPYQRGADLFCALAGKRNLVGGGSGPASRGVAAAFGELTERRHFANGSFRERSRVYSELAHPQHGRLRRALQQLRPEQPLAAVEELELPSVLCTDLLSGEQVWVPAILIFHRRGTDAERAAVPVTDSSGASYFTAVGGALQSAYNEFVERQCLLAVWHGARARSQIRLSTQEIEGLLPSSPLARDMARGGEVVLADVSQGLGRYAVLAAFFSEPGLRSVHYAIGGAASVSAEQAARSALAELGLSFECMAASPDPESRARAAGDRYRQRFLSANKPGMREELPFFSAHGQSLRLRDWSAQPTFSEHCLLERIGAIGATLWGYFAKTPTGYFTKVLSPDFFLHMAEDPTNRDNTFMRSLELPEILDRTGTPLPFP